MKLALLASVARCFFERPHETKPALGAVIKAASQDRSHIVRERAIAYYRMLQHDVAQAEKVRGRAWLRRMQCNCTLRIETKRT